VTIRMSHDIASDNMFHYFGDDTGQADGSVVRIEIFLTFLEYWNNVCPAPVIW